MGHPHQHSRKDMLDNTDRARSEPSYHNTNTNITSSRRHTEPNSTHRHSGTSTSDHDFSRLCRATTYDLWDERHRQRAAKEPMVEYMCSEPISQDDSPERPLSISPIQRQSPQSNLTIDDDDEEAPLTIPSTYHYDPKQHLCTNDATTKPNKHLTNQTQHQPPQQQKTPTTTKEHTSSTHDQDHETHFSASLINKVSAYVLARANATSTPLTPESKQLVDDLAAEILNALKTGSWDCVPKELVREVRDVLT